MCDAELISRTVGLLQLLFSAKMCLWTVLNLGFLF